MVHWHPIYIPRVHHYNKHSSLLYRLTIQLTFLLFLTPVHHSSLSTTLQTAAFLQSKVTYSCKDLLDYPTDIIQHTEENLPISWPSAGLWRHAVYQKCTNISDTPPAYIITVGEIFQNKLYRRIKHTPYAQYIFLHTFRLPRWWRQKNHLKPLYTSTRQHGITTQKTVNWNATAIRTSNLKESVHIKYDINHTVQNCSIQLNCKHSDIKVELML